jgi:hypothetical protein
MTNILSARVVITTESRLFCHNRNSGGGEHGEGVHGGGGGEHGEGEHGGGGCYIFPYISILSDYLIALSDRLPLGLSSSLTSIHPHHTHLVLSLEDLLIRPYDLLSDSTTFYHTYTY